MAYATYTDYEARYGTLSESERALVTTRLSDAATILDGLVDVDEDDDGQLARLKVVSCAMVNRAMMADESEAVGVSNASYTMGPFTQSATFANPSGDMYLTKLERELLGVSSAGIGFMRPVIGWSGA